MKTKFSFLIALLFAVAVNKLHAFGGDVKVLPDATKNEHRVDLDVAFNGWIYEAVNYDSAYSIMLSKDNGSNWTEIVNYNTHSGDDHYEFIKVTVTGSDTNSLKLFVAGVRYVTSTNTSTIYVDEHNGSDGSFVAENYQETYTNPTRGIAITNDYRYPANGSSPFTICVAYVRGALHDSIFIFKSTDGGSTYSPKELVTHTPAYYRNVSLTYAYSNWTSAGRFYMAFDEYANSGDKYGHVYTAHTVTGSTGISTPVNIDSLYPSVLGVAANPSISAAYNPINNDSSELTVFVVMERNWQSSGDIDIVGFYNKNAPNQDLWKVAAVNGTADVTLQPDLSFDPTFNNFLITYYDTTTHSLPYDVFSGINFTGSVTNISQNYADDQTHFVNPWPVVVINPVAVQAAFAWSTVENGNGIAYFDAEYRSNTSSVNQINNLNEVSVFPNPANTQLNVQFTLEEKDNLQIDLYDLTGRLVMPLASETEFSGKGSFTVNTSALEQGMYNVVIKTKQNSTTHKIVISH